MPVSLKDQLVVAISSRALFDFEEENHIFENGDPQAYMQLQLSRLDVPAAPGVAFSLVRKLLAFNTPDRTRVTVVVLSRNDPVSGMRVFRSAANNKISVERGVFTQGRDPFGYLRPLGAQLFLSANEADVRQALALGYPAARVATNAIKASENHPNEVRIAFDGDAVLFGDESEQIYQTRGLNAFLENEKARVAQPLEPGPFKPLLEALNRLQKNGSSAMRIRTALVTARSAPAHERAIRTLMDWGVSVDEAMFLGGLPKGGFLREFEPDFFFDDQTGTVEQAACHVPTGQVMSGITNAAPVAQQSLSSQPAHTS